MNTANFFDNFYRHARHNCVLIMDEQGTILSINNAFKMRFGYGEEDLKGSNFSVLFTKEEQETRKPERELGQVLTEKSASDENYLVNKDGDKIWVTGESVLIENDKKENYIIKVVHNIQAQKQLERFLLQSHEFIETIFDSVSDSGLLLLDTSIRVVNANKAFLEIFELKQPLKEGSRLSEIENPFWQSATIKQDVVSFLVNHESAEEKRFNIETINGHKKTISFCGKVLEATKSVARKLLIIVSEIK